MPYMQLQVPLLQILESATEEDIILKPEKWETIWGRIFSAYGRCHIFVSGGEPSIYPGFYEIIRFLLRNTCLKYALIYHGI